VAWIKRVYDAEQKTEQYKVGIEFAGLKKEDKKEIAGLIRYICAKEK